MRGISWFAPIITTARDFSDLMDAVTVKARIEACFAAFITQADDLDAPMEPSENVQPPSADNPNAMGVPLEPGMMKIRRPGQDVKFAQPTSTSQIESVMMFDLMSMASAVGVTYDQLSGDLAPEPHTLGGDDWLMVRGEFPAEGQPRMLPRTARC